MTIVTRSPYWLELGRMVSPLDLAPASVGGVEVQIARVIGLGVVQMLERSLLLETFAL